MKQLVLEDLAAFVRGAAILGSGGGGCSAGPLLQTRFQMEQRGPIQLLSLDEIDDDDLIVPVGWVGAPLVNVERLPRGDEFERLIELVEKTTGRRVAAVVPGEIGGANALAPLGVGRPVLDGDTIGRAFPEMQMSSCNLHGVSPAPAFVVDCLGNCAVLEPKDAATAEELIRQVTCDMGMSAAVALYLMDGWTAKQAVIRGSISRALELGRERCPGELLTTGTIVDVTQELSGGFLRGTLTLDDGTVVDYQNEYLFARREGELLAATPDIITLLEEESAEPIPSERLRYGLRVQLVTLPAPPLWKTPEGLKLVGPEVFK
jgi:uncharacterized protein